MAPGKPKRGSTEEPQFDAIPMEMASFNLPLLGPGKASPAANIGASPRLDSRRARSQMPGRRFKEGDRVAVISTRYNPLHRDESYTRGEQGVVMKAPEGSTICSVRLDGDYHTVTSVLPLRRKHMPHRMAHISVLHLQVVKGGHRNSMDNSIGASDSSRGNLDLGKVTSKLDHLAKSDDAKGGRYKALDTVPDMVEGDTDAFWKAHNPVIAGFEQQQAKVQKPRYSPN